MSVSFSGHLELVKSLVENVINISIQDNNKETDFVREKGISFRSYKVLSFKMHVYNNVNVE